MAFQHSQQEMVDTWLKPLEQLVLKNEEIKYYEFPVMARMGSWKRWMIYNGMKMGIRDTKQRSRTVSFHIDKPPFKDALNISDEDNIYLFVVSQDGSIKGNRREFIIWINYNLCAKCLVVVDILLYKPSARYRIYALETAVWKSYNNIYARH